MGACVCEARPAFKRRSRKKSKTQSPALAASRHIHEICRRHEQDLKYPLTHLEVISILSGIRVGESSYSNKNANGKWTKIICTMPAAPRSTSSSCEPNNVSKAKIHSKARDQSLSKSKVEESPKLKPVQDVAVNFESCSAYLAREIARASSEVVETFPSVLHSGEEVQVTERERIADHPTLSESDSEREESLKHTKPPRYPIFVNFRLRRSISKIRRVHTDMDGLFIFDGQWCIYWPSPREIPTKFSKEMEEKLEEWDMLEEPEMAMARKGIMDNYEKYRMLWHIHGVFRIFARDEEDLKNTFEEKMSNLILYRSTEDYFASSVHGHGTRWKWEMIIDAKWLRSDPPHRVLYGAQLAKKPFVKVKYDEEKGQTVRQEGSWEDEPDSDPETQGLTPFQYKLEDGVLQRRR